MPKKLTIASEDSQIRIIKIRLASCCLKLSIIVERLLKKVMIKMTNKDVEVVLPNAIGQDSLVGQTQKVSDKPSKTTQNDHWAFHE